MALLCFALLNKFTVFVIYHIFIPYCLLTLIIFINCSMSWKICQVFFID